MGIWRRLRGILGIATTWGVAFSLFATTLVLSGVAVRLFPVSIFGPRQIVAIAIENFLMGGLAGTLFSLFFATGERRQTLESLSMPRVALWGFLGVGVPAAALVLGAIFMYGRIPLLAAPLGVAMAGAMGSAMSVATIKLARRAPALPERTEI